MTTRSTRLFIILGLALALLGGGAYAAVQVTKDRVNEAIPQVDLFGPSEEPSPSPSPSASPTPPAGADIKGPLNMLILGRDTREEQKGSPPHGDVVMILHVDKDLTSAYLTSLPRDLVVDIPAFTPSRFGGERSKLTHALTYGARVPGSGSKWNLAQGFQLLAKTVSKYTGIARFDAGAIISFGGYVRLINAIGGVDIYVDQKVVSIHRRPDGVHRATCRGCAHGYSGPRMTYNVGTRHMNGWMALDYARQRYITGSDYARQRHQRQLIKAMLTKVLSGDLLTDPTKLDDVLGALGETFTFDGRGRKPSEFAYALRNIRPANLTLVGLPGSGVFSGGAYRGERLDAVQSTYFAALRADKLDAWTKSHPKLVNLR
ncbi:LCP family protein [Catellatospora sp. NPDC049133]|jgi:LCP family protein required for cell wall assembly|uniref:LCP family protein n=1 Tax=Catellatospora sp. NPDC049133 TaxID=3155499 RepID=UPI0033CC2B7B